MGKLNDRDWPIHVSGKDGSFDLAAEMLGGSISADSFDEVPLTRALTFIEFCARTNQVPKPWAVRRWEQHLTPGPGPRPTWVPKKQKQQAPEPELSTREAAEFLRITPAALSSMRRFAQSRASGSILQWGPPIHYHHGTRWKHLLNHGGPVKWRRVPVYDRSELVQWLENCQVFRQGPPQTEAPRKKRRRPRSLVVDYIRAVAVEICARRKSHGEGGRYVLAAKLLKKIEDTNSRVLCGLKVHVTSWTLKREVVPNSYARWFLQTYLPVLLETLENTPTE